MAPYLRGNLHLVTDRQVLHRPTHFCSLMDNCNSNSLQHCQLSCWKLCQAYIKDKFLPLLPFPYKSVKPATNILQVKLSQHLLPENLGCTRKVLKEQIVKWDLEPRSLTGQTGQTGDKDSISGAQIISVINFYW